MREAIETLRNDCNNRREDLLDMESAYQEKDLVSDAQKCGAKASTLKVVIDRLDEILRSN